jgi:hypothetical protein
MDPISQGQDPMRSIFEKFTNNPEIGEVPWLKTLRIVKNEIFVFL